MENKNYILQEIMDFCPSIVQLTKANTYSVSSSYFDHFSSYIMKKIKSGQEPVYYFSAVTPFQVEPDYFENLPEKILQKTLTRHEQTSEVAEELKTIAPLLNTISKKPVLNVPPGYFEKTYIPVYKPVTTAPKVVSINAAVRKILKYAAAAVVAAILAIGVYLISGKESINSQGNGTVAEIKNLSEQEIVDFLKTNSSLGNATSAGYNTGKENDIKSSVKQMSDKEIQQFLQDNSETDEI